MDDETLASYDSQAAQFAETYESARGGISEWFDVAFPKGCRVLDIGAGSGRDLARLLNGGWDALGVEPSIAMVRNAKIHHPELDGRLVVNRLPGLSGIPDGAFDGVLCSAVLMHVSEEHLFDAIFSIRRVLRPGGRVLVSLPIQADGTPVSGRDGTGRLYNGLAPGRLELLLSRCGFRKIAMGGTIDTLGRADRTWSCMLFTLEATDGSRSIDRIEAVLNRDAKTATYKLALFRALAELATTHYNCAQWLTDGRVGIPVDLVAQKWLGYYWPIVDSDFFIPQMSGEKEANGKKILFRESLTRLAAIARPTGGLPAFLVDVHGGTLSPQKLVLNAAAMKDITAAIVNGPVVYARGGGDDRLFGYDGRKRHILMTAELWLEFFLMGPWIREATILRWSEMTAGLSRQEVGTGQALELLIRDNSPARNVQDSRNLFDDTPGLTCVWTGVGLSSRAWDVDHAIPYSLWRNNDLWNLFPAARSANNAKRDRLPSRDLLAARRHTIQQTWEHVATVWPTRFFNEVGLFGMGKDMVNRRGWPTELFRVFVEAMEVTALQRGVERWGG